MSFNKDMLEYISKFNNAIVSLELLKEAAGEYGDLSPDSYDKIDELIADINNGLSKIAERNKPYDPDK